MPIVRAAGGLLWREGPSGPQLAVVHRPRKDGWSLPKGKLEGGESWRGAALREVREETGCEVRATGFAGATCYLADGDPKVVLYWHMALVREGSLDARDEIEEVAWLAPDVAMERVRHDSDRRLVARALRRRARSPAAPAPAGRRSHPAARLGAAIAVAAGLALAVTAAPAAKRRALLAGGATGLVGAASAMLAGLAAVRRKRPRR